MSEHRPMRWTPGPCRLVWSDDRSGEIQGGAPEDLVALFEVCEPGPEGNETYVKQIEALEFLLSAPDLLAALEQAPDPRIWSHPTASDLETMLAIREWAAIYFEWYRSVRAAALVKARKV